MDGWMQGKGRGGKGREEGQTDLPLVRPLLLPILRDLVNDLSLRKKGETEQDQLLLVFEEKKIEKRTYFSFNLRKEESVNEGSATRLLPPNPPFPFLSSRDTDMFVLPSTPREEGDPVSDFVG